MVLVVRRDEVVTCVQQDPSGAGALQLLETVARELDVHNRVVSYRNERTAIAYPPDVATPERDLWIMPMYLPPLGCAAIRIGTGADSVIALYDFAHMGLRAVIQDQPLADYRVGWSLALGALGLSTPGPLACWGAGAALDVAIEAIVAASTQQVSPVAPVLPGEAPRTSRGIILLGALGENEEGLSDDLVADGTLIVTSDLALVGPLTRMRAKVVTLSRAHTPKATDAMLELGAVLRGEHELLAESVVVYVAPPAVGFVDVATAWWIYTQARAAGLGIEAPLVTENPEELAAAL